MAKKRVLVIDDEPSLTRLLKFSLEQTGRYEVRAENHASHGLTAALEFRPDLVLLDVIMPDASGDEVAAQFQADQRLTRVPIVFLTAACSKMKEQKDHLIIGRPFIAKPVSVEALIESIEKHFSA